MILQENLQAAFLLTLFAGLSTGIGSAVAYFLKKPKKSFLSFILGFSGGVMLYISFMELLPEGILALGELWGVVLMFLGMAFIGIIDFLIPEFENPHHPPEFAHLQEINEKIGDKDIVPQSKLKKTSIMSVLAIGIHNFPEGLAAFGAALGDINLGILIAIAIAIHNIPEGIAVSIPIYIATGDKNKAFLYSFLSGLAEPIGALVGYLILRPYLSDSLIGGLLAFIAGIMIYISLDEVLPLASSYSEAHTEIIGIISGMIIMAISLILL